MRRIGILGGTCDAPHSGQLLIVEEVRIALELEEIWFIPTYVPPHKQDATTEVPERINMVNEAIHGNDAFKINTIEVDRLGKSYTVDTMRILKEEHPDTEFFFIIGADMVEYLPHWYQIDHLIELVSFVGVKRAGYQMHNVYQIIVIELKLFVFTYNFIINLYLLYMSLTYSIL